MSVFIRNEDGVVSRHPRNAWALTCLLVSLRIHGYYADHTNHKEEEAEKHYSQQND